MIKPVKIPKGWRRLRNGTTIQKGDKFRSVAAGPAPWLVSENYRHPERLAERHVQDWAIYIRRIKPYVSR